ncbi:hypothetical protein FPOA_01007 [Fusarium poae]|uniref:Uncharacterized protein n=1 Tax=Fusarium poae TaxID=36050 RepID=A0A1B8B2Y7_FUSPO|nr:hypothetical protein FPOA_01007 [Fusarium poae]
MNFLMASSGTLYPEEKGNNSSTYQSMVSPIPSTLIEAHLSIQTANLSGVDMLVPEGTNSLMAATIYWDTG